jgi:hypothetical protein
MHYFSSMKLTTLLSNDVVHWLRRCILLLLAGVIIATVTQSSDAFGTDPAKADDLTEEEEDFLRTYWEQEANIPLHEELQTRAVALAAERFGTSPQRALYQLLVQQNIADLRSYLFNEYAAVYTDIRLDHSEKAHVTIYAKQQSQEMERDVRRWLDDYSIGHHGKHVTFSHTDRSLTTLYDVQRGVKEYLANEREGQKRLASTSVDRVPGHVTVTFYEWTDDQEELADDLKERYGKAVKVSDEVTHPVQGLSCTPTDCEDEGLMRAGLQVTTPDLSGSCTSGIMMHSGLDSDEKSSISAAQCFDEGESIYHPEPSDSFVGGIPGGGRSGDSDSVRIYMGTNADASDFDHTRWIYENEDRQRYGVGDYSRVFEISVGDEVYQSGAASVLEMGEVVETDVDEIVCARFCVDPERGFWTDADVRGGDSGGATYARDGEADAYGLISGGRHCDGGHCLHTYSTYIVDVRSDHNLHVTGAE